MLEAVPPSRWWPPRGRAADAVLATVITVATLVEIATLDETAAGRVALAVAAVVVGVALAWRRRNPLGALVVVLAPDLLLAAFGFPSMESLNGATASFLLAIYSTAEYEAGLRARAGLAYAAAMSAISVFAESNQVEDYVFAALLVSATWAAGRAVRSRLGQVAQLTAATVRLEVEQEERARDAVLAERARIARELHDVVAHTVTAIVVQAGAAQGAVRTAPDHTERALSTIQEIGRDAQAEMVRLLGLLRADHAEIGLAPQPSLARIRTLVDEAVRSGIQVDLAIEGAVESLPEGLSVSGYRIVQEALTNVRRHAGPVPARVRVEVDDGAGTLHLLVANDAPAPGHVPSDGTGHGLLGMRERTEVYGGSLEAAPCAGGGFTVTATIPINGTRGDGAP